MPLTTLPIRYLNIAAGIDMAYLEKESPSSSPTLLLLHGIFDHKGTWNWLMERLPNYRIIAPDLVGHGHSSRPLLEQMDKDHRYSPDMQAEYLQLFIEKLALKSLVLVGSSLGGGIALRLYLNNPTIREKTRALVLVAAAGYHQALPGYIGAIGGWLGRFLQSPLGGHIAKNWRLTQFFTQRSIRRCFYDSDKVPDELCAETISALTKSNTFYAYRFSARNITPPDMNEFQLRIATISSPTLIFWGREDRVINPLAALRFAADIDNAELKIFDQCGHAPHIECAEQMASCLLNFLQCRL